MYLFLLDRMRYPKNVYTQWYINAYTLESYWKLLEVPAEKSTKKTLETPEQESVASKHIRECLKYVDWLRRIKVPVKYIVAEKKNVKMRI